MTARRVAVVYGTRPEAIKMAPIVRALAASDWCEPFVVSTGQHASMVEEIDRLFAIEPDRDLAVQRVGQPLATLATRVMDGCSELLREARPDAVLVQGDTTSALMAALAAAYEGIPVGHVEAGLRTGDRRSPFPEELNRVLIGHASELHFAATPLARSNLLREGIDDASVLVTGNTVIDALRYALSLGRDYDAQELVGLEPGSFVLVTAHRRESWGAPMRGIGRAIARLARQHPSTAFVVPAHLNPLVRADLLPPLDGLDNVRVCEPLGYADLCRALADSAFALTDSGGIQEEAPAVGTPVLVLRDTTERLETLVQGSARLVGVAEESIVEAASELLSRPHRLDRMRSRCRSPYGDGHASDRIVRRLGAAFGVCPSPEPFRAQEDADAG